MKAGQRPEHVGVTHPAWRPKSPSRPSRRTRRWRRSRRRSASTRPRVNLLAGRAADRVTAMQKDLHEPDDPRVMEPDAGIADRPDGDGESDPLQQGKVDVHVEALRLKVGKAVCDGLKLFAHGVEVIQAFA